MSFDQALICRESGGIYAASWLAGTSSSQILDIERVNVTKTCDALNLSMRTGITPGKRNHQLAISKDSSVLVNGKLPFRVCSNIWFGTLKIYRQQVNNLYKLSADLAIRSSASDIFREGIKRKSNSPSYSKALKRRKITTTETITSGKSNPNYSQLLDDFEQWTQQYCHNSEDASVTNAVYAKSSSVRHRTQVHIREITIREISATTAYDDISELDDDYGFGEATNEEIATFFTFNGGCDDQNMFVNTTHNKRKIICEGEPPGKQTRYSHDTTIKNDLSESTPLANAFLSTPLRPPRTICEISKTPTNHEIGNLYCEDKTNDKLCTSPTLSINKIKDEPYENDQEATILSPHELEVLKQEKCYNDITFTPQSKTKKNKSKLIIDENIKIEESAILEQLLPPQKPHGISIREYLRKSKHKRRKSAKELLKRLNKRTLKFCKFFKQQIFINQKQFQYEYLQLVHDILKLDYRDEWATEIFPEWQRHCKSPKMRMKTRSKSKVLQQQTSVTMDRRDCKTPKNCYYSIYDNSHIPTNNDEDNIAYNTSFRLFAKYNDQTDFKSNSDTPDEWSPFGVMKKLLKIWRYWPDCKIEANDFCHSATTSICKAIAFSSLLSLSRDQFIELTKRPTTIEMDKIVMGNTSNNVLKAEF